MKINKNIIIQLEEYNIPKKIGLSYLIALYHKCVPKCIPKALRAKVNVARIVGPDDKGTLKWRIPLYEEPKNVTDQGEFLWVLLEYLPEFEVYQKHNRYKRECKARMIRLFRDNPNIRKEEIIGATKMYIDSCLRERKEARYVKHPHYFIEKGRGVDLTQEILTWVDMYREETRLSSGRNSARNTMD